MAGDRAPGGKRPSAQRAEKTSRRGWERPRVTRVTQGARSTFRLDGPSPSAEILARHDAELEQSVEGKVDDIAVDGACGGSGDGEAGETDQNGDVICF